MGTELMMPTLYPCSCRSIVNGRVAALSGVAPMKLLFVLCPLENAVAEADEHVT